MDRTVREHILELEALSYTLTAGLLHASDARQKKQIEGKLRAIDAALAHFHAALQIESFLDNGDMLKAAA
jgi:hypothetical protein